VYGFDVHCRNRARATDNRTALEPANRWRAIGPLGHCRLLNSTARMSTSAAEGVYYFVAEFPIARRGSGGAVLFTAGTLGLAVRSRKLFFLAITLSNSA